MFPVAVIVSRGFGFGADPGGQSPGPPERSQGGGYLLRPDRQGWIARIADQPFEFDADPFGRPGLETDPVNVSLGVSFREARPLDHGSNTTRGV